MVAQNLIDLSVVVDRIMKVLGQTVVSTGAYIVQGGTKAPAARYIWSLYFGLERVTMIRGFLHQALVMKATRRLVAKLVVVIDDDPLILEATEGLLRSWGCCVRRRSVLRRGLSTPR